MKFEPWKYGSGCARKILNPVIVTLSTLTLSLFMAQFKGVSIGKFIAHIVKLAGEEVSSGPDVSAAVKRELR
jgi:hypothetical protein